MLAGGDVEVERRPNRASEMQLRPPTASLKELLRRISAFRIASQRFRPSYTATPSIFLTTKVSAVANVAALTTYYRFECV